MSDIASFKPSLSVTDLLSEELRGDSENFTLFIKAYYEWLQTVKITFTGVSGTFERDEIITGNSSLANAVVKQVDVANNVIVVRMSSLRPFDLNEIIEGGTSNATATIISLKDNVVRQTGQILNYRDATKTVDKYVEYLKNELYSTIPPQLYADERFVARKFKEFFKAKSNEDSYKFLFRILYGENIEIRYPGEDLLRVSDGKYEKTTLARAVITSNIFDFLNQTITGANSAAIGNVVDIKLLNIGSTQVAEMILTLVSGTFDAGEQIEVVGDDSTNTTLYGMVTGFTINDAGSGYSVGDTIAISSNTGAEAQAVISSIKSSPITSIKINTNGVGYRLNTNAAINNTGTGGTGLAVRVTELANTYSAGGYTVGETATISIINRGSGYFSKPTITLEDTTISALGLLSAKLISIANTGTNYAVGDALVFTGGSGVDAAGNVASVIEATTYDLLFEDGFRMLSEDSYDDIIKNEDWSVLGGISRVELTNFGTSYTTNNLPTITVSSGTGSGANLVATNIQGKSAVIQVDVANNSTGIGSIRAITLNDFGVGYNDATANATAFGDGNANIIAIISGSGTKEGTWINDDGKIDYKIIQDSEYYQDFSYVIRSGLVFEQYSAIVKEVIHPAGMQFFGEILIQSELDVSANFTTAIETFQNIVSYVYYFTSFIDASSPGVVGNINIKFAIESLIQGQTSLYNSLLRVVQIKPELDVSPIISSTIQILENVNEYILYLESFIEAQSDTLRTEKNITLPKFAPVYVGEIVPYTFGDELIASYASELISTYASSTFDFEFYQTQIQSPIRSIISYLIVSDKIDVSPLITSTIQILENVNKYILYLLSLIDVSPSVFSEKNITMPKFAPVHLGATVPYTFGDEPIDVYSSELISTYETRTFDEILYYVQADVPIRTVITYPVTPEYVIDITSLAAQSDIKFSLKNDINVESTFSTIHERSLTSSGNSTSEVILPGFDGLENIKISAIASEIISSYANSTFTSETLTNIKTYNKITGTVSITGNTVIGSGTDFLSDTFVGSDFIVSSEKFKISNISNSTYMELNVNAAGTYINVSAYV
jgi:hypothetical protein